MKRPVIQIPRSGFDKFLDLLILVGLVFMVLLPLYYYNQLPDQIPIHFNGKGEADGFGSKNLIFLIPVIGLTNGLIIKKLNNYPHKFNYPVKITEQNAFIQYSIATRMMRMLNTFIILMMLYICYSQIRNALGQQSGLGQWFLPLFITAIFIIVVIPIYQSYKYK